MKRALNLLLGLAVFGPLLLFTASSSKVYGAAANETIVSRTAEINGVKLHYITAGHGAPLILLHGYAETSLMWNPIIPVLAERFTVIAPGLHGGLRTSGTHACGMGLFRFVPTSGQGFRATLSDQAAHASTDHRRREVVGRSARATNQAGCDRRDRRGAEGHRALGA